MIQERSFGLIAIALFLVVGVAFAAQVMLPSSFSVNQSTSNIYNISINNTNGMSSENVTLINITLPTNFTFIAESNGTDSGTHSFSNESNVLTWSGDGLVANLSKNYFWFNATVSFPGTYNITITSQSTAYDYANNSNISVTVNDTVAPAIGAADFSSPTNNGNYSGDVLLNATASDAVGVSAVRFNITNGTGQVSTLLATALGNYWNATLDSTSLADGLYNVTATANDSAGNSNTTSSALMRIRVDDTAPALVLIAPANATSSTTTAYNFTFNATDATSDIANCSLIFNGSVINTLTSVSETETNGMYNSSLAVGTHNWSVNCTDYAGNVNASEVRTLIIEAASAAEESSPSASGVISAPIYLPSSGQLEAGYNVFLLNGGGVSFRLNDEAHSLRVNNITNESVGLTVSSTPQTKIISVGEEWKVELNSDKIYDLSLKLSSISFGRANVTIKSISEPITIDSTSSTTESADNLSMITPPATENGIKVDKIWVYVIVAVLVIALIVFLVSKRFRKQKSR